MDSYVKEISAQGVHGRFDVSIKFKPGVNILYGKNGSGKTTLLHILSNALNGDYKRFVFLQFANIDIILSNDNHISIENIPSSEKGEGVVVVKLNGRKKHKYPVEKTKKTLMLELRDPRSRGAHTLYEEDLDEFESNSEQEESAERIPLLEVAYFPAFRTMIDAWVSTREEANFRYRIPERWYSLTTLSARRWFGPFIPLVSYPSLTEIEHKLSEEINRAKLTIGKADREQLTDAFFKIFESLSESEDDNAEKPSKILDEIKQLYDELQKSPFQEGPRLVSQAYKKLKENIKALSSKEEVENTTVRVLSVYRSILEHIVRIQKEEYANIQRYLESVNTFLESKQLYIDSAISPRRGPVVGIKFSDNSKMIGLRSLSSGERQIVALIYAASHMSNKKIALIDEPEISLHVDWQRKLLKSMSEQIGSKQIIACTHSPVIAADYLESQVELILK